jgi:hypothetical protein
VLNIQFGRRPSILQRDYIANNISVYGINILLWVIELPEKNGSSLSVFERVEGKLLCLIFNLDAGSQSYREITLQKVFLSGA